MEVKQNKSPTHLELELTGKLDGYWADQLSEQLAALIREGSHRILLNAAGLSFVSSAGIRVLIRTSRQLKTIGGAFGISNPSDAIREVVTLSHLTFLFDDARQFAEGAVASAPAAPTSARAAPAPPREIQLASAKGTIYALNTAAVMELESLGAASAFGAQQSVAAAFKPNQIAWGAGALGDSYNACRNSFGEFLAVSGGVATLPTDRSNRPDFLLTTQEYAASIQVLSAICCTGDFAYQLSFDRQPEKTAPITELAKAALDLCQSDAAAIAIIGETDGLVGAMMKKSPALATAANAMAYPDIREWMGFTTERVYAGESAIILGVVARNPGPALEPHVRSIGDGLHAHLHAAAFGFRPLRRGLIDLAQEARQLFEEQPLRGVMHLIRDERPIVGAGVTQMVRGAMWVAPVRLKESRP